MTGLPGKEYNRCIECGRIVQVYPVDAALAIWPCGSVICRSCADQPHDDEIRDGDESPQ